MAKRPGPAAAGTEAPAGAQAPQGLAASQLFRFQLNNETSLLLLPLLPLILVALVPEFVSALTVEPPLVFVKDSSCPFTEEE